MAGYRQVDTKIWKDAWFCELSTDEKLLFVYLFTNEMASISGLYEITVRVIVNETGLSRGTVEPALQKFQEAKKIFFDDNVIWVVNMAKYHRNASPKTMTKVKADVSMVRDCKTKLAYLYYAATGKYPIDTVSIPIPESVSVKENAKESGSGSKNEKPKQPPPPEPPDLLSERSPVFKLYEREIGIITPMIAEALKDAEKSYPFEWFEPAFQEAASHNARNWKYIEAVLKRWKVDGFQVKTKQNHNGHSPGGEIYIDADGNEVRR